MKFLITALVLLTAPGAWAIETAGDDDQHEYERSIDAKVRNKLYYKAGTVEAMGLIGVMPYDSVISHTVFGGRLNWHFTDHYGWEVIDALVASASTSTFATNLVSSQGISNLQAVKLKTMVSSAFLLSPVYGKIRFFGSTILHFDFYAVLGLGMAQTDTIKLSTTAVDGDVTESIVGTKWNPMLTAGVGFKVFINRAMGIIVDLRNYVVNSETYGKSSLKSNFSAYAGLAFYLPPF